MNSALNTEETPLGSGHLKNWLEYDYNPFFVFGPSGEVVYLNRAAELLSGYEPVKTFNDLALSYASIDFGYKTTFMPLGFGKFHFFAVTVGYEDEDRIGIKLYQSPAGKENTVEKIKSYEETNIYVLIDIAISLTKARMVKTVFKNEFDPSIPEFRLSQNDFTKVLRKVYEGFSPACAQITTVLKIKAGEFLYVGGKKYPLIEMIVKGESRTQTEDSAVESLASGINIAAHFEPAAVSLEIPLVVG
ncbi:MAG: hypothetical protein AB7E49_10985 [Campylobacterales bacterium]